MLHAVITGLLLGLALVFSVGPVIFTLLKLRINYSITSAVYFAAGVWLSDLLWVITANFFSSLLGKLITYKLTIGIVGGIFLLALGIYYLFFKKFHTKEELDAGVTIGTTTHLKLFLTGFFINTLNPGVIALWFAAATKSITDTFNERIVLFTVCLATNISADILKIHLAGKLRSRLTDKNIVILNKISGLLFLVFGVALIVGVIISD